MAGDVVFIVEIEKHSVYERKGADLFYKKKISLLEALTGFSLQLEHLDKTKFTVATAPGEIISHSKFPIFSKETKITILSEKKLKSPPFISRSI
jgi:DnaJ family protein A protein 2